MESLKQPSQTVTTHPLTIIDVCILSHYSMWLAKNKPALVGLTWAQIMAKFINYHANDCMNMLNINYAEFLRSIAVSNEDLG